MLQRIQTTDQNLQAVQDNVDAELVKLQTATLSGGQILTSLSLTSGADNIISHQLGYAPTLILALAPNVDTRIWSPTTATLSGSNVSKTKVNLRCSTTCTASVWLK